MTDDCFYKDLSPHVYLLTSWGAVSTADIGQPWRKDWACCLVSSIRMLQRIVRLMIF